MAQAKINNSFYDELGERWYEASDDPVALLRAENKTKIPWITSRMKKVWGEFTQHKVLDVGCGAGFASNHLAEQGLQVTGIDLAEKALEIADRHSSASVDYQLADATALPFADNSFDSVICLDFLEHTEQPQRVIVEISRVLKPGGLFFYHTFSRNWLSWLVVIKGVEWFVKNTPKNMHVYPLFINHSEVKDWCQREQMQFREVTGLRPCVNSDFFRMLTSGEVPESFQFTTTNSTLMSYLGYAQKLRSSNFM